MFKKLLSLFILISFFCQSVIPAQAGIQVLPAPGTMVNLSPAFEPVLVKGLKVNQENPFLFDFIVDSGNTQMQGEALKAEADRLIKYFFAGLTIPEKDLWVNLSPYEKDRIVPESLSKTALGRDLLAQDYILKQLTATLIYPEKELGKAFWDKVYTKAQQMYGTSEVPVNTFNKVWIIADKATVFERNQVAYVLEGHLKVMLEEDYLAKEKNTVIPAPAEGSRVNEAGIQNKNNISSEIIKEIILPELEKEVNQGKNFASLRQMYYSLILAGWFKTNLKQALLNQVYSDKSVVKGLELKNSPPLEGGARGGGLTPDAIYQQYLQAYKKGVFNYIKEESSLSSPNAFVGDTNTTIIPRKYFSGGITELMPKNFAMVHTISPAQSSNLVSGAVTEFSVNASPDKSAAMVVHTLDTSNRLGLISLNQGPVVLGRMENDFRIETVRVSRVQGSVKARTYSGRSVRGEELVVENAKGGEIARYPVPSGGNVWVYDDKWIIFQDTVLAIDASNEKRLEVYNIADQLMAGDLLKDPQLVVLELPDKESIVIIGSQQKGKSKRFTNNSLVRALEQSMAMTGVPQEVEFIYNRLKEPVIHNGFLVFSFSDPKEQPILDALIDIFDKDILPKFSEATMEQLPGIKFTQIGIGASQITSFDKRIRSPRDKAKKLAIEICQLLEAKYSALRPAAAIASTQFQGKKILVVDDEKIQRLYVRRVLKEAGAIVSIAANGNVALSKMRREKFDLVISDVRMGAMSGWMLAKKIKEEFKGARVIIRTGSIEYATRSLAKKMGVGLIGKASGDKGILDTVSKQLSPAMTVDDARKKAQAYLRVWDLIEAKLRNGSDPFNTASLMFEWLVEPKTVFNRSFQNFLTESKLLKLFGKTAGAEIEEGVYFTFWGPMYVKKALADERGTKEYFVYQNLSAVIPVGVLSAAAILTAMRESPQPEVTKAIMGGILGVGIVGALASEVKMLSKEEVRQKFSSSTVFVSIEDLRILSRSYSAAMMSVTKQDANTLMDRMNLLQRPHDKYGRPMITLVYGHDVRQAMLKQLMQEMATTWGLTLTEFVPPGGVSQGDHRPSEYGVLEQGVDIAASLAWLKNKRTSLPSAAMTVKEGMLESYLIPGGINQGKVGFRINGKIIKLDGVVNIERQLGDGWLPIEPLNDLSPAGVEAVLLGILDKNRGKGESRVRISYGKMSPESLAVLNGGSESPSSEAMASVVLALAASTWLVMAQLQKGEIDKANVDQVLQFIRTQTFNNKELGVDALDTLNKAGFSHKWEEPEQINGQSLLDVIKPWGVLLEHNLDVGEETSAHVVVLNRQGVMSLQQINAVKEISGFHRLTDSNGAVYVVVDGAMVGKELMPANPTGGIDLMKTTQNTAVQKEGEGVQMTVDPAMINRIREVGTLDRLDPVIYKVTPITSIWPILGLELPKHETERLAGV